MLQQDNIVIAGAGGAVIRDKALLRRLRGSIWDRLDPRFFVIMLLSLLIHSSFVYVFHRTKLRSVQMVQIENIPERFARLIVEKPIEKASPQTKRRDAAAASEESATAEEMPDEAESGTKPKADPVIAKKNVAARVASVEKKIRTVGVLGILTGVGGTAKGPSVVDVLGARGNRKERIQDLEQALEATSGLKSTGSVEVLNRSLVRSKEVDIGHRESIDDLLQNVNKATTRNLAKKGDFIIKPPERIEGAASSSAMRDTKAISSVVRQNKLSIKLTYEKYLKRDPALAGKVTIRFTIASSGAVTEISILENSTGNTALEQEIIRKIRMWKFEAIPEGDVTVTYPFLFQPS